MKRRWLHDAEGGMFASMAVLGGMGLLVSMGARLELAVGLPVMVAGVIGWSRWAYLRWGGARDGGAALTSGEVDVLRGRFEELDGLHARMAELEERMEFSERLLARKDAPSAPVDR
jgi:hypothetical protein